MLRYVLATGFIASYLNMRLVVGRGFLDIYTGQQRFTGENANAPQRRTL
jgi:hypothetical protein